MALLSQMFRTVAITGRTDTVNAWFADRQGGRWAEQTVRAAFPQAAPPGGSGSSAPTALPKDPAERLRELTELHRQGVVTDAEFEALRARLYR
jgi:Short C-terminal domain